jgi:Transaldolase/Fructose-6-phosphate aldolase
MSMTKTLHDLGQSLWLDNITREILDNGTLRRYIEQLSVTGLTSNPTIFDEAIGKTAAYDKGIRQKAAAGMSGENLFIELALEDLPIFSDPNSTARRASTAGYPWKCRRCWPTTHRAPLMRRYEFTAKRTAPTCS